MRAPLTEYGPNQLVFVIPSHRSWLFTLLIGFFLVLWTCGEYAALHIVVTGLLDLRHPLVTIFMLLWLAGWTIGGVALIYSWLWNVGGREIVTITQDYLRIGTRIPGFCRTKEFPLSDIRSLRLSPKPTSSQQYDNRLLGTEGGALLFDYGPDTVQFGMGLGGADAKQMLEAISKQYPRIMADSVTDNTA